MNKKNIVIIIFILIVCISFFLIGKWDVFQKQEKINIENKSVLIVGERWWNVISHWIGTKINDDIAITALHVVDDYNVKYYINWERFFLIEKSEKEDIAYIANREDLLIENKLEFSSVQEWERVYAYVYRDGVITKKEWYIKNINTEMLTYNSYGKIIKLSWKILTTIDFVPWDSGAMIWNENGNPVWIFHAMAN